MALFRVLSLIISLSILGLICTYVYRRLVRDVTTRRSLRVLGLIVLLSPMLALPLMRLGYATGSMPPELNMAVLSVLGFILFTMMALLGFDAVRGAVNRVRGPRPKAEADHTSVVLNPQRRLFLSRAVAGGAVAAGAGTSVFGVYKALTAPEVTVVTVKLPGLPKALDGFSIVQLSDIHVGAMIQEKFLDVMVGVANRAKGDLIAITGDLVDGTPGQLGRYVARMQNLSAKYGVYFCSGNHDYYSGWEAWAQALPGIGFNVLRNRRVEIGGKGASFDLIGVEDLGARWGGGEYDLEKATSGRDLLRPSVLMAHQPSNLPEVSAKHIGLQLSGHTHGGQLFPATVIGQLIWGNRNAGLSKYENTWQYTSRGCGFVALPMRVDAPPEVVKIVLTV